MVTPAVVADKKKKKMPLTEVGRIFKYHKRDKEFKEALRILEDRQNGIHTTPTQPIEEKKWVLARRVMLLIKEEAEKKTKAQSTSGATVSIQKKGGNVNGFNNIEKSHENEEEMQTLQVSNTNKNISKTSCQNNSLPVEQDSKSSASKHLELSENNGEELSGKKKTLSEEEKARLREENERLFKLLNKPKTCFPKLSPGCVDAGEDDLEIGEDDISDEEMEELGREKDIFDENVTNEDLWHMEIPKKEGFTRVMIVNHGQMSILPFQVRRMLGDRLSQEKEYPLPTGNSVIFMEFKGQDSAIEAILDHQVWLRVFSPESFKSEASFLFEPINFGKMYQLMLIQIHANLVNKSCCVDRDWRGVLSDRILLHAFGHIETRKLFDALVGCHDEEGEFDKVMEKAGFTDFHQDLYVMTLKAQIGWERWQRKNERLQRRMEIREARERGRRAARDEERFQEEQLDDSYDDEWRMD